MILLSFSSLTVIPMIIHRIFHPLHQSINRPIDIDSEPLASLLLALPHRARRFHEDEQIFRDHQ